MVIPDPHAVLRGDPIADHMRSWGESDLYNSTRVVRAFELEPTSARHGPVVPPPATTRSQVLNPEACGTSMGGGSNSPLYSEVGDDLGGHDGDISSVLEAGGRNRVSTPRDSFSDVEVEENGSPVPPASGDQGDNGGAPSPPSSGGRNSSTPRDSFSDVEVEENGSPVPPASGDQGDNGGAPSPPSSGGRNSGDHENLAGKRSAPGSPTGTGPHGLIILFPHFKIITCFQLQTLAGRSTSEVFL